jgi:hypothetical protein
MRAVNMIDAGTEVVIQQCDRADFCTQIFNTYGDLGNSSMLRKYGFVEAENLSFEDVLMNGKELAEMACNAGLIDVKEAKKRFKFAELLSVSQCFEPKGF